MNNQSMHFDLIDEVNHHDFDANYHITLTLQRHCESGNPPGVPGGVLGPPSPQRTPLDPLGVCRCWGYNFRLGNLFYYYEKT